jgi:hypothetical protein
MYIHEFTGRCPSAAQIKAQIKKAIMAGHDQIELRWGENWIELEHNDMMELWSGHGWIRRISGDDIARGISR